METQQPKWKLFAKLGDVNPIDYGGYFVYRDETGVYTEEAELLISPESDDGEWIVYRFTLDRCKQVGDYLIPFRYDPRWSCPLGYDEWFNGDLDRVASCVGSTVEELREQFCSADPVARAFAYRAIGDYHGFDNLDSYPLTFNNRAEVEERYRVKNS